MVLSLAFLAIAGYAGLAALLWFLQEKILFHPMPAEALPRAAAGWTIEPFTFTTVDGTRLAGCLAKPSGPPAPLLVLYGGNAEEVTGWSRGAGSFGPRALLLVNYRGYGNSEGVPSEKALVSDALEIFDAAVKRTDIDGTRAGVIGISLGTGIAVQVAAQRPVKALVLASPYDSVSDVAAATYPFLPVRWLVRHRFDSAAHAPRIKAPVLVAFGTADTLIRPAHSKRLAALWGGPVEELALAGAGHNDVSGPAFDAAVRGFLDRHL